MVSAYPGLFYPGQVYPSDVDAPPPPPPPPPTDPGDTVWGSWLLAAAGTWTRRETRVLTWTPPAGQPTPSTALFDGNGTDTLLDGGGTVANVFDGNGSTDAPAVSAVDGNGSTDTIDGTGTASAGLYDGNG